MAGRAEQEALDVEAVRALPAELLRVAKNDVIGTGVHVGESLEAVRAVRGPRQVHVTRVGGVLENYGKVAVVVTAERGVVAFGQRRVAVPKRLPLAGAQVDGGDAASRSLGACYQDASAVRSPLDPTVAGDVALRDVARGCAAVSGHDPDVAADRVPVAPDGRREGYVTAVRRPGGLGGRPLGVVESARLAAADDEADEAVVVPAIVERVVRHGGGELLAVGRPAEVPDLQAVR